MVSETGRKDRGRRIAQAEPDPVADLKAVLAELETDNSDSYPPPMLLSQISYLSGMINAADQKPGNEAYKRQTQLEEWYAQLLTRTIAASEALGMNTGNRE